MTHRIIGVLGAPNLLSDFAHERKLRDPVPLRHGFYFLPIPQGDWLQPHANPKIAQFTYLRPDLVQAITELSRKGTVLYLETDYWGGEGHQSAMLFRAGECIYGPVTGDVGTINRALQLMDLEIEDHDFDEFEAVGLSRYRSNDDWLKHKGIRIP